MGSSMQILPVVKKNQGRYGVFNGLFAIVPSLFLMACGVSSPTQHVPDTAQGIQVRNYLDAIELTGRLSVRYQRQGNDEALHGNFMWSQAADSTTVTLLSPLGQTIAVIKATPQTTALTQAGRPPRVAANADLLAAEVLGWPLPIAGLRDWLQGFVLDAKGKKFVATPQANEVTTADGWHIHYQSWQERSAQLNAPKRIDLERTTAQAGDVSIRIVIDE